MNVLSTFSGVGGMDLGLTRAGWRHVGLCERDEYRRAVLAERFPGVPRWHDVRDVGLKYPDEEGSLVTWGHLANGEEASDSCLSCGGSGRTKFGPCRRCTGQGPLRSVRRLTPRECERLQGFPDDWTLIDWQGKPAADSRRYAACGDAVTVPVAEWLGRRIAGAA